MKKFIVFEDDYIVILEKPFGILSQNDSKNFDSLEFLLKQQYREIFIINRLDRQVGGLIIFAKNKLVTKILFKQFQEKKILKKYFAVVCGQAKEEEDLVNWIMKNQKLNFSKIVNKNSPYSKRAELTYKTIDIKLDKEKYFSLVKIILKTGRHHQIRAQMAYNNLPLWGDSKYNKQFVFKRNLGYISLWSAELSFLHPINNKKLIIKSNPPLVYPFNLFDFQSL